MLNHSYMLVLGPYFLKVGPPYRKDLRLEDVPERVTRRIILKDELLHRCGYACDDIGMIIYRDKGIHTPNLLGPIRFLAGL
jgi:hypothetical protein